MAVSLVDIHWEACTTSLPKWRKLLGLLRSINLAVSVSRGIFTRLQHSLKRLVGRHAQLTTDVHNKLEAWRELVRGLANRPNHLRKIEPFAPSWIGNTDVSGSGMGEVCRDPDGKYFVWHSPFSQATQAHMVSSSNPTGDATIKNTDLGALLMQLLISSPRMAPLAHIHAYVNNTAAQRWSNRGSVSTASSVGTTLWELSLADRRQHIHDSI